MRRGWGGGAHTKNCHLFLRTYERVGEGSVNGMFYIPNLETEIYSGHQNGQNEGLQLSFQVGFRSANAECGPEIPG